MARSSYIYVVTDEQTGVPAVAFTVKYEMLGWLKRNDGLFNIVRVRDGSTGSVTDITEECLKETHSVPPTLL